MPPDLSDRLSLTTLVDPVHRICIDAAQAILPVYEAHVAGGATQVTTKADHSPLTAADQASHDVLEAGLRKLLPVPVVSEEGDVTPPGDALHWLVDPLDGTKEFLKANGQFTVNVALVKDGAPLLGLVQVPVDGRAYAGIPGIGAWKHEAGWTRIQVAPLYRDRPCRVVASRSHRSPETDAFIAALEATGLQVEQASVGSSLKLCQVAEGAAHVYPRLAPTMHWDTAAAHALVEGAGGTVTDLEGNPLRYGHGELRNPWFIAGGATRWPWHERSVASPTRTR